MANYLGFAEVVLYNVSYGAGLSQRLIYRCTSIIRQKVRLNASPHASWADRDQRLSITIKWPKLLAS